MTSEQRKKFERGLALFDFDGTLIPWDTQALFANYVIRQAPIRRAYLPLFASFAPFYKILGDEGLKRVFLSYLWRATPEQVDAWARSFVEEQLIPLCYPSLLEKLAAHREAGHLTVLASASPEWYIREVGRVLGFDLALGTQVEMGCHMPLFPDLRNHKGAQKVTRLSAYLGAPLSGKWPRSHGYTDSSADLPMMHCCEGGTLVNPSARLVAVGEAQAWEILRPPVPWSGKVDKAGQILRFVAGI
ncbi:MAG: HAD family hydrolase [Verrucomicrobiales bacterium]